MSGPAFPFAFFDVDDTLVRIKSMFDFFRFFACEHRGDEALHARFEAEFARLRASRRPRTELNRAYYRWFAGLQPAALELAAEAWAEARLSEPERLFLPEPVRALGQMRTDGAEPVFVSGSFPAVLAPIAAHLGVTHILATRMLLGEDGRYTGEIGTPQTIGAGKGEAIRLFLSERGVDPSRCVAMGDDLSDLPMLETVGSRIVVGDGTALAAHARAAGWPILPGCEAAEGPAQPIDLSSARPRSPAP